MAKYRLRELARFFIDENVKSVARRMFVTNAMDSIMAYTGAILGNFFAGTKNYLAYMATGIGLALSISMLSNFLATFIVEQAEREIEVRHLSKYLLKDIEHSVFDKAPKVIALYVAAWSALGSLMFPLIASIPFVVGYLTSIPITLCVALSLSTVIAILFCLGTYLGSLIGRKKLVWGIKLASIGLIPIALLMLRAVRP